MPEGSFFSNDLNPPPELAISKRAHTFCAIVAYLLCPDHRFLSVFQSISRNVDVMYHSHLTDDFGLLQNNAVYNKVSASKVEALLVPLYGGWILFCNLYKSAIERLQILVWSGVLPCCLLFSHLLHNKSSFIKLEKNKQAG